MNFTSNTEHFERFRVLCQGYLASLGLFDWDISYKHEDVADSLAWCSRNAEGKIATLGLCLDLQEEEPSEENLRKWAKHEVLHVLLGDFHHMINLRTISDNMVCCAEHAIIRRLERVIV